MASRYRTLDASALREVVTGELFSWGASGVEGYALALETLPVRWPARSAARSWARTAGPAPEVPGPEPLRAGVRTACEAAGACFHPGGRWERGPEAGSWVELGPGGQVVVHSGWQGTPARAGSVASSVLDALRRALIEQGLDLVCLGRDPWNGPQARAQPHGPPWTQLEERAFAAAGGRGLEALHATAGTEVRLAFGGPLKGPRRWRAAWLLVPRLVALFAHAPLEEGGSARCKSARARAWMHAESSRCGYVRAVLEQPRLEPHEQYLQFAADARVAWVARDGQVHAPARPLSFAQWMAAGVDGWFPELDDWRAHLAGLRPLVRPEGGLIVDATDCQGRAFAGLPLLVTAALLADDEALEQVLERFGDSAAELEALHAVAVAEGLLDARLAREARALLALVADALLRAPPGWASPELVSALVAFDQAFGRAGRTPADDLLELYLEHGALGRDDLEGLESRWCAAAGTPVSWRDAPRHA